MALKNSKSGLIALLGGSLFMTSCGKDSPIVNPPMEGDVNLEIITSDLSGNQLSQGTAVLQSDAMQMQASLNPDGSYRFSFDEPQENISIEIKSPGYNTKKVFISELNEDKKITAKINKDIQLSQSQIEIAEGASFNLRSIVANDNDFVATPNNNDLSVDDLRLSVKTNKSGGGNVYITDSELSSNTATLAVRYNARTSGGGGLVSNQSFSGINVDEDTNFSINLNDYFPFLPQNINVDVLNLTNASFSYNAGAISFGLERDFYGLIPGVQVKITTGSLEYISDPFDITVNPVNDAPTLIQAISSMASSLGNTENISLDATFNDVDGDDLTHAVQGLDASMYSLNQGTLTLNALAEGNYTFTVTATDPSGEVAISNEVNWSVTVPVNNPPIVPEEIVFQYDEDAVGTELSLVGLISDDLTPVENLSIVPLTSGNYDIVGTTLVANPPENVNGELISTILVYDAEGNVSSTNVREIINPIPDAATQIRDFANIITTTIGFNFPYNLGLYLQMEESDWQSLDVVVQGLDITDAQRSADGKIIYLSNNSGEPGSDDFSISITDYAGNNWLVNANVSWAYGWSPSSFVTGYNLIEANEDETVNLDLLGNTVGYSNPIEFRGVAQGLDGVVDVYGSADGLSVVPSLNYEGMANIEVYAVDTIANRENYLGVIDINFNSVNDAPILNTAFPDFYVIGQQVGVIAPIEHFDDPDFADRPQDLTYQLVADNPNIGIEYIDNEILFTLPGTMTTTAYVIATDPSGATSQSGTFTLSNQ